MYQFRCPQCSEIKTAATDMYGRVTRSGGEPCPECVAVNRGGYASLLGRITHEDRMTQNEIDGLFTVKGRTRKARKARRTSRGVRKALQRGDHIAEGVSTHPPGSKERLADLAAFYNLATSFDNPAEGHDAPSPFNV